MLSPNKRIREITLTGSYQADQEICQMAGLKKVTMELGYNCPVIVMLDADPGKVATALVPRGYGLTGQACVSVQRAHIHINKRYKHVAANGYFACYLSNILIYLHISPTNRA